MDGGVKAEEVAVIVDLLPVAQKTEVSWLGPHEGGEVEWMELDVDDVTARVYLFDDFATFNDTRLERGRKAQQGEESVVNVSLDG